MNSTRILATFLASSVTAFCALCYFNTHYEEGLLYFANLLIQHVNLGIHLLHTGNQLYLIAFIGENPTGFKIENLDRIWAGQATVIGAILSTDTSRVRKAIWLMVAILAMFTIHAILLFLVSSELLRQYFGLSENLAAYGAVAFKLYTIGIPVVLLSSWVVASRRTLFSGSDAKHISQSNITAGWRVTNSKKLKILESPRMRYDAPRGALGMSPTRKFLTTKTVTAL